MPFDAVCTVIAYGAHVKRSLTILRNSEKTSAVQNGIPVGAFAGSTTVRILIISQYFWPENFRINDLAQGLQARGHEVLVVTAFPNYPAGKLYPGTRMRPWKWDMVDGIRVLRIPLYPDHRRSAVRRVLNYCPLWLER